MTEVTEKDRAVKADRATGRVLDKGAMSASFIRPGSLNVEKERNKELVFGHLFPVER